MSTCYSGLGNDCPGRMLLIHGLMRWYLWHEERERKGESMKRRRKQREQQQQKQKQVIWRSEMESN